MTGKRFTEWLLCIFIWINHTGDCLDFTICFSTNEPRTISCSDNHIINVQEAVFYLIGVSSRCDSSDIQGTPCKRTSTFPLCHRNQTCVVTNDVFSNGMYHEPECTVTPSLLHIRYTCVPVPGSESKYKSILACVNPVSVTCPEGAVIDVQDAALYVIQESVTCDMSSITGVTPCKTSLPLTRCHGKRECLVKSRTEMEEECAGSHALHVDYICYPLLQPLYLSGGSFQVNGVRDLLSPGFPVGISANYKQLSCQLTSTRQIDLKIKLVSLERRGPGACPERIRFRIDTEVVSHQCSGDQSRETQWRASTEGNWEIIYEKSMTDPGGRFWLQIRGDGSTEVNIDCEVHYHPQPSRPHPTPLIPQPPIPQVPIVPRPARPGTQAGSDTVNPDDVINEHDVISVSMTTTTRSTEKIASVQENDSEESGDSVLPAVIGGVVGTVVLAAVLLILLWFVLRRRMRSKGNSQTAGVNNVYYEIESLQEDETKLKRMNDNTDKTKNTESNIYETAEEVTMPENEDLYETADIVEKEIENKPDENTGEMYATVNKDSMRNKDGIREKEADEVVMFENDELYEANNAINPDIDDAPNEVYATVNKDSKKKKDGIRAKEPDEANNTLIDHNKTDNGNNDETLATVNGDSEKETDEMKTKEPNEVIMCENDDDDGDGDDDNDSVIVYQDNDLYCSSVDLCEDDLDVDLGEGDDNQEFYDERIKREDINDDTGNTVNEELTEDEDNELAKIKLPEYMTNSAGARQSVA